MTIVPKAVISVVYTPVQGEDPEKLGANEFTAGNVLILNCTLEGSSGDRDQTYEWSMTGNMNQSCASCNASATPTLTLLLYSDSAGNYTCTTSDSEPSESFTVTVVGELLFQYMIFFSGKLCPLMCSLVISFCRF